MIRSIWRLPKECRHAGAIFVALHLVTAAARAEDGVLDSLVFTDPDLPKAKIVRKFPDNLVSPWLVALKRPEADLQRQAAVTITVAHKKGVSGLEVTVVPLLEVLEKPDHHRLARLAAARALVELDDRQVGQQMFEQAKAGDQRFRDIIEPALARWNYRPAVQAWLERLGRPETAKADLLLAIRGLEQVQEFRAVPRLAELLHETDEPWTVRLEAAHALGAIRTAGSESEARRLLASTLGRTEFIPLQRSIERNEFRSTDPGTSDGRNRRIAAAWLLRRHKGEDAIHLLQDLSGDSEPAVAGIALERLLEIDSKLIPVAAVDPALASSDAKVRSLAIEFLVKQPTTERLRLLADKLNDEHPDVRTKARRLLHELAKSQEKFKETVIQQGMRVLAGDDWRGLEQATILLVQLDHKPAAERLIKLLTFNRPEVLTAAGWGLRRLAVPDTLPAVSRHFQYVYELVKGHGKLQGEPFPIASWDPQLSQLAQFIGQSRYKPAEEILRNQVSRHRKPGEVPIIGNESRGACIWALGLFYEGKPEAKLIGQFEERLNDIPKMMDPGEFPLVRQHCAVALGRMKAKESLMSLRRYYHPTAPSVDLVSTSCGWAIQQLTGEPLQAPLPVTLPAQGFRNFLQELPPERRTGG